MAFYETVFIARQDLTDSQVEEYKEKFSNLIKEQGGKVLKTEMWGLRTLAYRIRKNRKGHYVLIESEASGAAVAELDRILGLEEDILRSMTVRLTEASSQPSPILNKSSDSRSNSGKSNGNAKKEAA